MTTSPAIGFLQADTPRDGRKELKRLLGLQSLSGIVYAIPKSQWT